MPAVRLQDFLADATPKAAESLAAALARVPADRRAWSPEASARTALDQAAECAILNGYMVHLLRTRTMPISDFGVFFTDKAEALASGEDAVLARLRENTVQVAEAIRAVPDEDLSVEVPTPVGTQTLAQVIAYPHWNMTYHEGQINYIASMLGCLD
jgi:hypothetical protein